MPVDPNSLLILALWREANGAWRVRITRSTHRGESGPESTYAATLTDVMRAVSEWFDQAVTPS